MVLDELLEAHAAAGERYRNATDETHAALVELTAIDAVLASDASGYHERPVRTFFDVPQNLGTLAHPKFSPIDPAICWRDEIKERRDELLAAMEAGR
jgi:hypothetical protein